MHFVLNSFSSSSRPFPSFLYCNRAFSDILDSLILNSFPKGRHPEPPITKYSYENDILNTFLPKENLRPKSTSAEALTCIEMYLRWNPCPLPCLGYAQAPLNRVS